MMKVSRKTLPVCGRTFVAKVTQSKLTNQTVDLVVQERANSIMIEEGTADNHSPELVEDAVDASEDYDDESDEETDVQLGFIEKSDRNILFKDSDWRNWDGGVVGGRPVMCFSIVIVSHVFNNDVLVL